MRGTPLDRVDGQTDVGIIPAYAGNTPQRSAKALAAWDHPRVCGEHDAEMPTELLKLGSSPRMRGTLRHQPIGGKFVGIIPAYAGNT